MNSRMPPMSEDFAGNLYVLGTDGWQRHAFSNILWFTSKFRSWSSVRNICINYRFNVWNFCSFFRGKYETIIMRIVDIQLSFPSILVALIILAAFGKGVEKTIIALILVQWAYYARTARAPALVEINKEYIDSARCLAFSNTRIMFKHIYKLSCPINCSWYITNSACHFTGSDIKFFRFRITNHRALFRITYW